MPTMASITVKKHDGVTDVIYGSKQPGSTSGQPAMWQVGTIGTAQSHRPELRFYLKQNGSKSTVTLTGQYPTIATDSTTGITSVIGRQKMKIEYQLDTSLSQVDVNEFVAQMGNLLASTLIKDGIRNVTGYGS